MQTRFFPKARIMLLSGLLLTGLISNSYSADFSELGKSLTPLGAEKKGNAAGTIPEWTGGISKAPANFDSKKISTYPHAEDKPLFTITATNADQYKANLTPGQLELLRRYPSYKMNVYPSRRTASYPQRVYDAAKAEAPKAKLLEGGNGIDGITKSNVPFPIPTQGIEVIWNHLFRDYGGSITRYSADFPVQPDGTFTPTKRTETIAWSSYMDKPEENRLFYYMSTVTEPATQAGEVVLVHETINQVKEPRLVWQYNPGQRRVIRAPDFSYDAPGIGVDGLRTNDDLNGFNGAPDRYNWKLIGKREVYIPYNNFKLTDPALKYKDIIGKANLNPDYTRFELHRVWVVEATLKPGIRHIYSKRVFFIDEDSWSVTHVDQYDSRNTLWRIREVYGLQSIISNGYGSAGEVLYDLQARRYLVSGLNNEEKQAVVGKKYTPEDFSVGMLRRSGK